MRDRAIRDYRVPVKSISARRSHRSWYLTTFRPN